MEMVAPNRIGYPPITFIPYINYSIEEIGGSEFTPGRGGCAGLWGVEHVVARPHTEWGWVEGRRPCRLPAPSPPFPSL